MVPAPLGAPSRAIGRRHAGWHTERIDGDRDSRAPITVHCKSLAQSASIATMRASTLLLLTTAIAVAFVVACDQSTATPSVATEATATEAPAEAPAAPPEPTADAGSVPQGDEIWRPALSTSWQWQLSDPPIDTSFDVDMYDIDLFDVEASTVAALHALDRRVVCYVSVGSWENWRPDADDFPESVIGNDYEGWAGERWLDIREIDLLAPIMGARLDECKAKGFDGIEPDNIDGYTNDTGFPLTYEDQLEYNIWLAGEAHSRGLSIGLKNDSGQISDLLAHFDWALTEDCFAEGWCEEFLPFVDAGKAVFSAEYTDTGMTTDKFCSLAQELNVNAILKDRELTVPLESCDP